MESKRRIETGRIERMLRRSSRIQTSPWRGFWIPQQYQAKRSTDLLWKCWERMEHHPPPEMGGLALNDE